MKVKRINIDELIDVLLDMKEQNFDYADISIRESDNTLLIAGNPYNPRSKDGKIEEEEEEEDDNPSFKIDKDTPPTNPSEDLDDLNNYIV